MLLAVGRDEGDGRRTLFVGLEEENVVRLRNDMPIKQSLDDLAGCPLEGWTLVVLGPEDTERFVARFGPEVDRDGG